MLHSDTTKMEQNKQLRIFRFFPIEAKDFFIQNKLWFSSVLDFNDPFELYPRYDRFIESKIDEAQKKAFAFLDPRIPVDWKSFKKTTQPNSEKVYREGLVKYPEQFISQLDKKFKIVSFTENLFSLLMWAHYASGHQGFVVEFNPSDALFSPTYFRKMEYDPERPDLSTITIPQRVILAKSKEWQYEAEHRLVMPVENLKVGVRSDGMEKCYHELTSTSVFAVYFGCRIDAGVKQDLLAGLKQNEWRFVKAFSMQRNHTNFSLEAISN